MPEDETNTTPTPIAASNPPVPSLPVTAPADTLEDPAGLGPESPAVDETTTEEESIADKISKGAVVSTELSPASPICAEVAKKISDSHNVLIALSSDPSVDEMAAAIGLSLYLDKLGKRATAIYSGTTPNALEFLKPGETFAPTADTLQDFVIAINKDKADHLRYKLDGDYVKIFITPYRLRISEEDLEFSYGDYNVDLVLALNIMNGVDLDAALREHGRIMHDAVIINITTGKPGKFGEIEWSDKSASSASEMISKLIYSAKSETQMEKDEATAFMTGIVAATNRFSNAKTTPETMKIASLLMESGANQQLIAKNITPDVENELHTVETPTTIGPLEDKDDSTALKIEHDEEEVTEKTEKEDGAKEDKEAKEPETVKETEELEIKLESEKPASSKKATSEETKEPVTETKIETKEQAKTETVAAPKEQNAEKKAETEPIDNDLLDDLKAAEASLAQAGSEATPDISNRPVRVEDTVLPDVQDAAAAPATMPALTIDSTASAKSEDKPEPDKAPAATPTEDELPRTNNAEKVIQPPADLSTEISADGTNKYGKMLENALADLNAPSGPSNPATVSAPVVASVPEINGVPEMNYAPQPGEQILPPPPAPPINMGMPAPATTADGTPFMPSMPPAQADVPPTAPVTTPAAEPNTFKIPGAM